MTSRFPKSLLLPSFIYTERNKRNKSVIRAIKLGILCRLAVIAFELIGVILVGSAVLFLDAIASFADVMCSVFLLICLKIAHKPPDEDHPFGHGRYEPLGGVFSGVLLIVLGIVMLVQQLLGAFREVHFGQIHPWAWVFPVITVIVLEIAYQIIIRIAKKQHSPALISDAYHYRFDSLTSLFATLALGVGAIWPTISVVVDYVGAISIALFMTLVGFFASRKNFNQLMDKVPEEKFFRLVKNAARQTSGVASTEKIRIQQYGPDAHVNIDVEVDPSLSVAKAHKISQQVRLEIQKAWPAVRDVTVHIEPFYNNDH